MVRLSTLALLAAIMAVLASTYQPADPQPGETSTGVTVLAQTLSAKPLDAPVASGQGSSLVENQCPTAWGAPVEAEILDPFRRPSTQFSAGNRGLEFRTLGGEPVTAVQPGRVVFAGPVGGHRFIVVSHTDGLKATYGYLSDAVVVAGQSISLAQLLGHAAPGFHLTIRESGRYIDPEPFLAVCRKKVRLVPVGGIDRSEPVRSTKTPDKVDDGLMSLE